MNRPIPFLTAATAVLWCLSSTVHADLPVSYLEVTAESSYESSRVYAGQTVASRAAQLGFNRGGEIASLAVDIGDRVDTGAELARLDQRSLRARLKQADADVSLAEANVEVLQAQSRLAENTAARIEKLRANGHVSLQELDEARLAATARHAELKVAEANLKRALAALEVAQVALEESVIVAPFSGIVQARHVDEGAQIQPAQPVLRLVEDARVEAHIGVPEQTAAGLQVGHAYTLRMNGRDLSGELLSVLPEVEASTRTRTAVFKVQAAGIPMGAVIELQFADQVAGNGFWLPVGALTASDRGLWGVYVINPEEFVERRLVEIIHTESDRVFVRGTLNEGDRVVDAGVQRLVPGQKVSARKPVVRGVVAGRN